MSDTPQFSRNSLPRPPQYNRGTDNRHVDGVTQPVAVGLYTIDNAILSFLNTKIKPVVTQDGKQIQVQVVYGNPERWKSAQKDAAVRDKNGRVLLPIMLIRRTGMQEGPINSPVNKYQQYVFKTGWNSRNIYDRFAVQNGITPSQLFHTTVIPDYYDVTYEAMIWTEYMEQMNGLIENISFESNEYWGTENNYRFKVSINQYEQLTELPANTDRMVRSRFTMNVKAYILPQSGLDKNGNRRATTQANYTYKKVEFGVEVVDKLP
jgi:hypothetical protein